MELRRKAKWTCQFLERDNEYATKTSLVTIGLSFLVRLVLVHGVRMSLRSMWMLELSAVRLFKASRSIFYETSMTVTTGCMKTHGWRHASEPPILGLTWHLCNVNWRTIRSHDVINHWKDFIDGTAAMQDNKGSTAPKYNCWICVDLFASRQSWQQTVHRLERRPASQSFYLSLNYRQPIDTLRDGLLWYWLRMGKVDEG